MRKKLFIVSILILLLLPVGFVLAQDDARQIADETVYEDVTLVNEDLNVANTGVVEGSVTILNGNVTVAGTIAEDLVVFNGDITLTETAVIHGECVTINGDFSGGSSRNLVCREINDIPFAENFLDVPDAPLPPVIETSVNSSVARLAGSIILSIMMGLIAIGVYTIAPNATHRIEQTMKQNPFASSAVGLLSFGAVPFLNLVLLVISVPLIFVCVGILGFPLMLGLTVGFIGAGFWSWVLWGKMVGEWVTDRLHWHPNHKGIVAVGTAVLTFILSFIAFSGPGWAGLILLLSALPLAWGMGATALTRFGTRPYPFLIDIPEPQPDKLLAVLETLPTDETD